MGNFSVNHYTRIDVTPRAGALTYVLDFAEIPTFELLQQWKLDAKDSIALEAKAKREAGNWLKNLAVKDDGDPITPVLRTVHVTVQDGAGGMPILRIVTVSKLALRAGSIAYEDHNYPGRTGWKEIVIRGGSGAQIVSASQTSRDLSRELTTYPSDASIAPPQDLEASLEWKVRTPAALPIAQQSISKHEPAPIAVQPSLKPFAVQQPTAPGSVRRGDFLSRLLQKHQLGFGIMLIGILVAFGLGAMHALSPGHGKTIVAAYLVGSRGTIKHAMFLGATVTLTHTISVFLLGVGVLCFERYIVPDKIIPWLGALSGLSIVFVGLLLLYRRARVLLPAPHHHSHAHSHHEHSHSHAPHTHTHGDRPHTHMPAGNITLGSLIALGISGGLVPCPSALVLMLSAIALGHAGLGLVLLAAFSCGLALVLMGIGILVIYAKQLVPSRPALSSHPFFRLVPVLSAAVVVCLGLGMTAISLGWIQPGGSQSDLTIAQRF